MWQNVPRDILLNFLENKERIEDRQKDYIDSKGDKDNLDSNSKKLLMLDGNGEMCINVMGENKFRL